jgi:hypothetical protein
MSPMSWKMEFIKSWFLKYTFLIIVYMILLKPGADICRSFWIACLTSTVDIHI